jgi:hypothetical protein
MPRGYPILIRRLSAGIALLASAVFCPRGFAQSPDFQIYLGIGQSNMEGGPQVSGLAAADPRFQVLSAVNCPSLNPPRTMGKWYTANPPLPRCTAGPGIVDWFGRTLIDSLPKSIKIGVIMVTIIGTKIEVFDKDAYQAYLAAPGTPDWLRNYAKDYGSNPYGRLIEMAKIAQKDGVIRGILLHQGESNVGDEQWPAKVKKIYGDIIRDLSLDAKSVPLLAGEVVNADVGGDSAAANIQIDKLPGVLPNSYVISSSQLAAGGDHLHFTAASHKIFGGRYANTMLSILRGATGVRPGEAPPGFSLGAVRMRAKNGWAEIDFEVPKNAFVSMKAYSVGGREIAEWAGRDYPAGRHTLAIDRRAMPTGVCILKMKAGGFSATRFVAASR